MGINLAGIVFANVGEKNLTSLTSKRTMASVPFGGKYRLVDFPLSNMSNSGINNVALIARNNFHSLMDHLGSGRAWDLSKRRSGLTIFSPYGGHSFVNRVEALYHIIGYIKHLKEDYLLITNSNHAANINYNDFFEKHLESGADITLMYKNMEIPDKKENPVVLTLDENNRIEKLLIEPDRKGNCNLSVGSMLIKKELLVDLVSKCMSANTLDFEKNLLQDNMDRLKIFGYEFKGHLSLIHTLEGYFFENMKLMNKEIRDEVFNPLRPIYTKVRDDAPSRYGLTSQVKNSLVAQGCIIEGIVENSIISKGVYIAKDAVVKNCIILQDCTISEGAHLEFLVIDKDATITENRILSGCDNYPLYIAKESVV